MNRHLNKLALAVLFGLAAILGSCKEDDSIMVLSQDLRFGLEAQSKTFVVRANCKWTITQNDNADWYTITPMSGRASDSIVTVTVNAYPDGDYRGSSLVVTSPGGHIRRTVFVSQNKLDFDGIINKVFAVTELEHWVTDFYDQIIEDEYHHWAFDPYDTTRGHQMFFFENGTGMQRNCELYDTAVYFPFTYAYDPDSSMLHISFQLMNDSIEHYDAEVLCASDSLYRVFHQYKPHRFERADHRKIGTITPGEKSILLRKAAKRLGREGIYRTKSSL